MSNNLRLNHRYINPDLVNFVKEEDKARFDKHKNKITCYECEGILNFPFLHCVGCHKSKCKINCNDDINYCSCKDKEKERLRENYTLVTEIMEEIFLTCKGCNKDFNLYNYSKTHIDSCSMVNCPLCKNSKINSEDIQDKTNNMLMQNNAISVDKSIQYQQLYNEKK